MLAADEEVEEEEEEPVEEEAETEEDVEFKFEVAFDEEFELDVPFNEVDIVEFEVMFPELDEPRRAVIGIPSVASEIAEAIAPPSFVLLPDNSGLAEVLSLPSQQ